MNIGVVCYPAVGGSGIVATELARSLAERGHRVHVISTDPPFRLPRFQAGIEFHRVFAPGYPVLPEPQYLLALTNRIAQVAREQRLHAVHAHYAIPHAAAAYLARQILAARGPQPPPRVVTTLHGTDITLLGSDPSYSETVAFCIEQSDAVTAVSASLRDDTRRRLRVTRDIEVIPNFVDGDVYRRRFDEGVREWFCPRDRFDALVLHVSNFRPVKRIDAVIDVFARAAGRVRARLMMVGDGPELQRAEQDVRRRGLDDRVLFAGEQQDLVSLLSVADVFLLASAEESFGLAALEAMACEVPVVATRVGGLPEVVEHGVTGFLHPVDEPEAMAESLVRLLADPGLRARFGRAARADAVARFARDPIVSRYERVLAGMPDSP
jgi:L-malate glycosyltransferase